MKIHNARLGLATNSSSTHSIILWSGDPQDIPVSNESEEFGWQHFTASDVEAKSNYLAITLYHNLCGLVGEQTAKIVIETLFFDNPESAIRAIEHGYIDHQSMMELPLNWDRKGVDIDFFVALKEYVLKNPVLILGGNDNGDVPHPLLGSGTDLDRFGLEADRSGSSTVARNDGDHWIIFNRENGCKLRFSMNGYTGDIVKAAAPELIDIKITDFCPYGCEFCYQGSTTEGKHADKELLSNLIYTLSRMKVFEVALGGGEPTLHPYFIPLLQKFRDVGIVPNFTTKNLAWLNKKEDRDAILESCGAFAYSAGTPDEVWRLGELTKEHGVDPKKVSVQYVLNTGGDLAGILEECRSRYFRLTILGFKETGFGKNFPQVPENWIEVVNEFRKDKWTRLGVDTSVIQMYGKQIEETLGVPKQLFTAEEGKFSMYIDAVTRRVGSSSYCLEEQYAPLPTEDWPRDTGLNYVNQEKLLEIFKTY